MPRRLLEFALVAVIATLQCAATVDVDDARQPTHEGRALVASTSAHGGVGAARERSMAPLSLGGLVTSVFALAAPVVSSVEDRPGSWQRACDAGVEIPLAPRPPPAFA